MEIIKPFKEKVILLPHIKVDHRIKQFFSTFLIESILFLILMPFALSVPAFLLLHSFEVKTTLIAVILFLIGLFVLFFWLTISILFFYSVTTPRTWQRWITLFWLSISIGILTAWMVFF